MAPTDSPAEPAPGATALGAASRLGALALLASTGSVLIGGSRVSTLETRVFRSLNGPLGVGERPLWLAMQFGNGLNAAVAPAIVSLALHGQPRRARTRAATTVAAAGAGGWQLAKLVKRAVQRPRPAALLDTVHLRDGQLTGSGFVSGHATVAGAIATAALAVLPSSWAGVATASAFGALALATAAARVHVGAHLPLDVVGGLGLGCTWGAVCAAASSRSGQERDS